LYGSLPGTAFFARSFMRFAVFAAIARLILVSLSSS
jgi:hypothetical protein